MAKPKDPEEDIILSEATSALLAKRAFDQKTERGCFLCSMILEDFKINGKLTGFPKSWGGDGTFPVYSKLIHIDLEKKSGDAT